MKRFKKLISVVLAVATVVSLTACGSGPSSSGGSAGGSATAAGSESKDTLIMGYTKEPDTVAPGADAKTNAQMVVGILYDGLVGKDPADQSVIVPSIADTWDFSEDGTVLKLIYPLI